MKNMTLEKNSTDQKNAGYRNENPGEWFKIKIFNI